MSPPGADDANQALHGIGVLVTRPLEQAGPLLRGLAAAGARAIHFPALAILPPRDPAQLRTALEQLPARGLAIFISPSAVQHGLAAVRARGPWPDHLAVAAVGAGTARILHGAGFREVIQPETGADSEHLLAHLATLPLWQQRAGLNIAIFRAETGREALGEALKAAGAHVTYIPCYRRGIPPQADPGPVLEQLQAGRIGAITIHSAETLDNLLTLLGSAGKALLTPLAIFVPHANIAAHAQALGLANTHTCPGGDPHLVDGIVKYFAHV